MKRTLVLILLVGLLAGGALAQKYELVEPKDTLTDYAEVVEPAAAEKVKTLSNDLRRSTSVNFKILVIRQLEAGIDAATYAGQIYRLWDVGRSEGGLEHGVLLFVSILDRQVKIVVGRQVLYVLPAEAREQIEWNVLAELSRGKFSEGIEIGSRAIVNLVLAGWDAERRPAGGQLDWATVSIPIFILFLISVILSVIFGGSFIMGFSIFVGGLFGLIFLDYIGMVLAAAFGFFLNWRQGK
jgi:uncharacterized membrane protein YgcG